MVLIQNECQIVVFIVSKHLILIPLISVREEL